MISAMMSISKNFKVWALLLIVFMVEMEFIILYQVLYGIFDYLYFDYWGEIASIIIPLILMVVYMVYFTYFYREKTKKNIDKNTDKIQNDENPDSNTNRHLLIGFLVDFGIFIFLIISYVQLIHKWSQQN